MHNTAQLMEFFGWMSVINMGFLVLASLMLVSMQDLISGIHSKMFNTDASTIKPIYFQYLANYKIVIFVFNLAPYIALKVMGS